MGCPLKSGGGLHNRLYVGAVLLAAGRAERMGGRPKPLLELGGVPLIRRNLIALSGAGVDELVVVTGHHAGAVEAPVRDFAVTLVRNPDYRQGQMTSLRAGLAALSDRAGAILIALADQPLLNADDITALIVAFKQRAAGAIVIPRVNGERGNPIVMEASIARAILSGEVSYGCRHWIADHPDRISWFDTGNRHYVVDLDTPDDLEQFRDNFGHILSWPAERMNEVQA